MSDMPESGSHVTLADILRCLQEIEGLRDTRRRDLCSAVRSVARLAGRNVADIVVDVPRLRETLKSFHPVQARMSRQRLLNIKSDFRAALEATGTVMPPVGDRSLTPGWRSFLASAKRSHQALFLARLARYCAATACEPEDVDEAVMQEFEAHLDARLIASDPITICLQSRYSFNGIVRDNAHPITLLRTRRGVHCSRPLSIYPESLQADLAQLLEVRRDPDLMREDAPDRPLSPVTLRNTEYSVRQALDAAVGGGCHPAQFGSLADLVKIDVVKAAFDELRRRNDGALKRTHHDIAIALLGIARHHVKAPEEDIAQLKQLKYRIGQKLGLGHKQMGERPKRNLAQFVNDPDNVEHLLFLPQRLMHRIKAEPENRKTALIAMRAAAIAILLSCPLRIRNLAALEIGRHIWQIQSNGKTRYQVFIPAEEVKNRQPVEAVLSQSTSRIVATYTARYRKLIAPAPTQALFPKRDGRPRTPTDLGVDLSRTVRNTTGIELTAHGFRHFAAFLFLSQNPGEYETVRRILGHRKLDTTVAFYAPLSTAASHERYADLLDMKLRAL